MKRVVKTMMWGSAAAAMLAVAPVWAADLKVAVVDFNRLVLESPQYKAVGDQLQNEFQPRVRELQNLQNTLKAREDKLQKDGATMTDDQRNREDKELSDGKREFQRKQTELQDDANARKNEELQSLQKSVAQEVEHYAKAQNYDLVLASGILYAAPTIDITTAVESALQAHAKAAAGAPAPAAAPAPKPASK